MINKICPSLAQAVADVPDGATVMIGGFGNAGMPRELVNRLHADISKAMNAPDIKAKLIAQGTDPVGSTPEAFAVFRKAEEGKWARVIKEANIRPQ
mgnify:CR=1 FL=1